MFIDRSAPVDTMGCHKCSDQDSPENVQRYHHLVALMLSSQTKDAVTYEVRSHISVNHAKMSDHRHSKTLWSDAYNF